MSSAGISRTGQGTKRAEAFCIAYVSQRSNKDGWLGYPLTTSFQKWSTAVCKIQANEERHLQQMRATLINTIPRSWNTVSVSASKLVTCHWFKRRGLKKKEKKRKKELMFSFSAFGRRFYLGILQGIPLMWPAKHYLQKKRAECFFM